jgi:nucleoside-diphosphate-sugar epimerase
VSSDLTGRRLVVTGSKGRIGSAVCERLDGLGARVVGVDTLEIDTQDAAAVVEAVQGADCVVHLAAIPSPELAPWPEVFADNVTSTFNVLTAAGEAGVRRMMLASSINASGLPMNSHDVRPAYYPFDEDLPTDIDDPYSLSKAVDEQTARMAARHRDADVVAVRFPLTVEWGRLLEHAENSEQNPADGVRGGWSYLDVRDAARVAELALTRPIRGVHRVFVCADRTIVPFATEDLLDAYAPGVPRLWRFVGREVPADLTRARTLLGFRAEHELELTERRLSRSAETVP